MNVAFRVDASPEIGTGHLMRCSTLADGLRKRGHHVRVLSRRLPEHLQSMLAAGGHEFRLLESAPVEEAIDDLPHARWLGTSQRRDATDTLHMLSDERWDLLVVDHYALDARWERMLRGIAARILVIDDLADRMHECDVLLDQNLYADMETRYDDKVPPHCQRLLGPRYALLRDEFRRLHPGVVPRTGRVERILVFFGGVDAENYTAHAIEALGGLGMPGLHVDVVVGLQHPFREQVQSACSRLRFTCHVQVEEMAVLMAAADLAIGAGGSACWERCCLGLPTLTLAVAENQRRLVEDAALEGLLYAPDIRGRIRESLALHLRTLLENPRLLQMISSRALAAVDGRGVYRVLRRIGSGSITIRKATLEDSGAVFGWRNQDSVASVSRKKERIAWPVHQSWFSAVLADPDRSLLIGEEGGKPVGVVRFDVRDGEAEVSIYLAPDFAEARVGTELLFAAESWLAERRHDVRSIRAEVLGGNPRSHRLFQAAGYVADSSVYAKRVRGS
jgi:UDP-2,4-diacetamido-2,4,6-trideoxy-beta-L-altropyranose hydrolase